ncbi:Alpha/beta hydrolase fold-1 [Nemania sp. FL0916]|nr:Alpha/beta hydrolase fold-1 [Nemania sp. FL0916]
MLSALLLAHCLLQHAAPASTSTSTTMSEDHHHHHLPLPSVVLVPGAWTPPSAYHKLVHELKAKSFEVHVPALPTNNSRQPPNSTFAADIAAVQQVVEELVDHDEKHVLMLMHSYGGVVGTSAVQGLTRADRRREARPGGVVQLVYVAAFMLDVGQNIQTVVKEVNLPGRDGLVKFADDNSGTWFPIDPPSLLYHDLTREDQKEQTEFLNWGNVAILTATATYAAWKDVPTLYVRAIEDRWLPPEFQDFCLRNAEHAGVTTVDVDALESGHSPYVKFAEEIAAMALEKALG